MGDLFPMDGVELEPWMFWTGVTVLWLLLTKTTHELVKRLNPKMAAWNPEVVLVLAIAVAASALALAS
jgi:hypothetical protein